MGAPVVRWFIEKLKSRLTVMLWGEVAADAEADSLLAYVANLDRIEEQAATYESQGKTHLARILREQSSGISRERLQLPDSTHALESPNAVNGQPRAALTVSAVEESQPADTQAEPVSPPRRRRRRTTSSSAETETTQD